MAARPERASFFRDAMLSSDGISASGAETSFTSAAVRGALEEAAAAARVAILKSGRRKRTGLAAPTLAHVGNMVGQIRRPTKKMEEDTRKLDALLVMALDEVESLKLGAPAELPFGSTFLVVPEFCAKEIASIMRSFLLHIGDENSLGMSVKNARAAAKMLRIQ